MARAVSYDGTQLAFDVTGHGEPLILLSGQATDRHFWDEVVPDLAKRHRVITFDARGTGESDAPEFTYTTRNMARDVIAILDAAGASRAHVYGISMGGRIAQWVGIDADERIGALVLGATTPGSTRGVRRAPDVDRILATADPNERAELAAPLMASEAFLSQNPALAARIRDLTTPRISDVARFLHFRASETHDSWTSLAHIQAPTLVIHGSEDRLNPTANAPLLAERIPGAEMVILEGARHLFHIECREAATRVVLDFLVRHPLSSRA